MRWSKEKRILINIYRGIFLWVVGGFLLAGCGSMEQEVSRRETLDQTIILEESETGSLSKKESGESEVPLEEGTTPDFIDGTPGVRTVKNLIRPLWLLWEKYCMSTGEAGIWRTPVQVRKL